MQPIVSIFSAALDLDDIINRVKFLSIGLRVSDLQRVKGVSHAWETEMALIPLCVALSCSHVINIRPTYFLKSCAFTVLGSRVQDSESTFALFSI